MVLRILDKKKKSQNQEDLEISVVYLKKTRKNYKKISNSENESIISGEIAEVIEIT